MKVLVATALVGLACVATPVRAEGIDIVGMYRLVSDERTIVATGQVIPTKSATGYITYTREGRMIALLVGEPRPQARQG